MDQLTTFAQRLRYAMVAKGLTNTSLAKLCGINRSNITRYLSGEYIAKQDVIYRIASKLDVDPQWLMGQSDDAVLDRVNSVEPLLPPLVGLEGAEKVQALLDANRPDEAAELCKSLILQASLESESSELAELLESLHGREDMRMLFKLAKDATPEDVRQAVRIIEALRQKD